MSATAISTATERVATPPDVPYRISAEVFYRMIDGEVFPPESRVYLWDGRIYQSMAKTIPHAVSFAKIVNTFVPTLPHGWFLWPENPITVADDKVPLPDVVIVRGAPDDFARQRRRPGPADVALVIEIAKSSVRVDTTTRLEAYARAGLRLYWVVNLVSRRIMVCSEPRTEGGIGIYGTITTYGPDNVIPLSLDDREFIHVPVRDLLDAEPAR